MERNQALGVLVTAEGAAEAATEIATKVAADAAAHVPAEAPAEVLTEVVELGGPDLAGLFELPADDEEFELKLDV